MTPPRWMASDKTRSASPPLRSKRAVFSRVKKGRCSLDALCTRACSFLFLDREFVNVWAAAPGCRRSGGGAEVLAPPKIGGERLRSSEGVLERPPEKIVAPNERVHPGVLESTRENRRDAWMRPFAAATVAPPEAMSMG